MSRRLQQVLSLTVPKQYVLPEFYAAASPADIAEALSIGSALFTTVKTASTDKKIKEIEQTNKREINRIQDEAQVKLAKLTESLQDNIKTARTSERLQAVRQFEQTIQDLEQDCRNLTIKNEAYVKRKQELEASRDRDIQAAEESTRRTLQDLLAEKDRSLQQARADIEATHSRNEQALAQLRDLLRNQTDEIRNLKEGLVKRSSNAKTKGNAFEESFRQRLLAAFATSDHFRLEVTGNNGIGHAGDFIMNWETHKILWETKDYDKTVPEEEVKKLRRDLKENKEVSVGIMVSKQSAIAGKHARGDFFTEFVEGKMLVYLGNFDRMSDDILPLVLTLCKVYWQSGQHIEEDDAKIDTIREIERLHKALEEKKKEWRVHKSHQESALRFTQELVEEMEQKLRFLLHSLQGLVKLDRDIPLGIFRDCLGDESSMQKIQTILSCVEPDPNSTIELNRLADVYANRKGGLSRDTARAHIKSVLLDVAILPNKGTVPAKVQGLAWKDERI